MYRILSNQLSLASHRVALVPFLRVLCLVFIELKILLRPLRSYTPHFALRKDGTEVSTLHVNGKRNKVYRYKTIKAMKKEAVCKLALGEHNSDWLFRERLLN